MSIHIQTEPIPVTNYVHACLQTKRVGQITSTWKVDAALVEKIIVQSFNEMGIYFALPCHKTMIMDQVIQYLKTSPDIIKAVKKAEADNKRRQQQSRHSDV